MTISAASSTPARRSRLLHRNLREDPPAAGHGVWLVDAQGREALDGSGGAAVSCLGHQHPLVLAALAFQAQTLAYAHTSFFTTEIAEALADELVGHEPGGLAFAYPVCGGSEATETALKLARQYFLEIGQPQRTRIIARRQSYHGNTLGALAAGGHDGRREPFAPLLSGAFSHVSPAYAYREQRAGESERDFVARLAAELEAEFQRLGPDTVAAFIAEPVVGGTSGCVPAPEGYFPAIRTGAGRRRPGCSGDRQGSGRRLRADRRDARVGQNRARDARRLRHRTPRAHLYGASPRLRGGAGRAARDPRGTPARACARAWSVVGEAIGRAVRESSSRG